MKKWLEGFYDPDVRAARMLGICILVLSIIVLVVIPEEATIVLVLAPFGVAFAFGRTEPKRKRRR